MNNRRTRELAKGLLPPLLLQGLLRLGLGGNRFKYGFKTWDQALSQCDGYDSTKITEALIAASRKVRDGKSAYERDGVVFDAIQHSWQLLAAILGTPRKGDVLRVLDWGGSLGSTYRQNKELVEAAGINLSWVIVEQAHIFEIGKAEFQTDKLKFAPDLNRFQAGEFDLVILASSICYVKEPEVILEKIRSLKPSGIAIDRTPITKSGAGQIGVQRVGGKIYKSSYPIRSFATAELEGFLGSEYKKMSEWICELQPDPRTVSKGFFFISS